QAAKSSASQVIPSSRSHTPAKPAECEYRRGIEILVENRRRAREISADIARVSAATIVLDTGDDPPFGRTGLGRIAELAKPPLLVAGCGKTSLGLGAPRRGRQKPPAPRMRRTRGHDWRNRLASRARIAQLCLAAWSWTAADRRPAAARHKIHPQNT